ncbi:uncharacterized protein LOC118562890 [Fundulus heteroclitus]|uniref:uncharacterized protein LOC118562890 n=1 Tax=Fundulus heteroclitus TaxID=8078 RepID=UPI00165B7F0C|nr:uncharacterized protein LOC118562890 [Fundulus heteroclitus]
MNITPVIFCILLNRVIGQDTFPAKILVRQRTVSEGSDLYVTCSMLGQKKEPSFFVYLLKDGQGFQKTSQKQNLNDDTFKISRVDLGHSGNYSCFYSSREFNLSAIVDEGLDKVEILVIAHFLPATLSVAGPSRVDEGNRVELRCTFSETLHTLYNCQLIHCCLKKNDTFLQLQVFDVARMEASFTIEGAVMRDSGHYSCLLLPSKCFQNNWNELQGINAVFLEVKEDLTTVWAFSGGFIVLALLFCLCLYWILNRNGLMTSWTPCSDRDQRSIDVLEQTKEEPEDASEEDSFSVENEEDSDSEQPNTHTNEELQEVSDGVDLFNVENELVYANKTTNDDIYSTCERIYHVPDDSPARRILP